MFLCCAQIQLISLYVSTCDNIAPSPITQTSSWINIELDNDRSCSLSSLYIFFITMHAHGGKTLVSPTTEILIEVSCFGLQAISAFEMILSDKVEGKAGASEASQGTWQHLPQVTHITFPSTASARNTFTTSTGHDMRTHGFLCGINTRISHWLS